MKVSFKLDDNEGFVTTVDGKNPVNIKNSISNVTKNFSPTEFMIIAMGACSSDDVVGILKKMKVDMKTFSVETDAERNEEHPKVLTKVHIKYIFTGDVDENKARKAVNISLSKYCSVTILARRGGTVVTYELIINGQSYGVETPDEPVPA